MLLDGGAGGEVRSGKPPAARMGREVAFDVLPERTRREVLGAYRELWDLGRD